MPSVLRNRELYAVLLAIIAGAGGLFRLRVLSWGTTESLGPAALPGIVAIILLAAGSWHLLCTVALTSPKWRAQEAWRWQRVLSWLLLAALAQWQPPSLTDFRIGPAENLALTLMLAATALADEGSLTRLVIAMALGALVALGDLDQPGGVTRLWDFEPSFVHGVIAAAIVAGLRLPLPGLVLAWALALTFEDALRRGLKLCRGDIWALVERPWSASLLAVAVLVQIILLALHLAGRRVR